MSGTLFVVATPIGNLEDLSPRARQTLAAVDFIAAENSMGFHAPQEAARILGEAIDYARQGQVAATAVSTLE